MSHCCINTTLSPFEDYWGPAGAVLGLSFMVASAPGGLELAAYAQR